MFRPKMQTFGKKNQPCGAKTQKKIRPCGAEHEETCSKNAKILALRGQKTKNFGPGSQAVTLGGIFFCEKWPKKMDM